MAKAKKKLLPKDFEDRLNQGDLEELKAVFDSCEIDARGGYSKATALAFNACPDDLSRWLVEQGADIVAQDSYGETPLHARAGHWQGRIEILLTLGARADARDSRGNTPLHNAARVGNLESVRLLLDHGASAEARNGRDQTPLGLALQECSNAAIERVAAVADVLLKASVPKATGLKALTDRVFGGGQSDMARVTPEMKAAVQRIGTDFEFHRAAFNPESVDAASAGLERLYTLFSVAPVPRRTQHDGKAPIRATAARWEDRHQELWVLLVPSNGAAQTVQGEVIRISGRISDEVDRNGGVNWDANFKKMGQAFLGHIASGAALTQAEVARAAQLVAAVRRDEGAARDLCRIAVEWVALNPAPVALPRPDYDR